jgi:nitrite reductase/ring-hydroxylating ferredoxin subunit/uncharacterized membrane protein
MKGSQLLERTVHRLESAAVLDKPAAALAGVLRRVIRPGDTADVLSGTPIGHPLHPALVAVPIGAWSTAVFVDLTGGDAAAARKATGLGNLAALPTALTGSNDWLSTSGAERRVGLVHAATMDGGLLLQCASWVARRKGRRLIGALLSLAGLGLVGAGGWLGGHLAYAMGVGVDTTAFQQLPRNWLDVVAEHEIPATGAVAVDADGVPVLLARAHGAIVAFADRCTHRGGPLHQGDVAAGQVTCPGHGSAFALADGAVLSGPATRPQPQLEVEVRDGRVRVRRSEQRTLRAKPVGR